MGGGRNHKFATAKNKKQFATVVVKLLSTSVLYGCYETVSATANFTLDFSGLYGNAKLLPHDIAQHNKYGEVFIVNNNHSDSLCFICCNITGNALYGRHGSE